MSGDQQRGFLLKGIAEGVIGRIKNVLGRPKARRWEYCLESPDEGATILGSLTVGGWAFHRGAPVTRVEVSLGGKCPVVIECTDAGPDVVAAFPRDRVGRPGFRAVLRVSGEDQATLHLRLSCADGSELRLKRILHASSRLPLPLGEPVGGVFAAQPARAPWLDVLAVSLAHWESELGRSVSVLDWTKARRLGSSLAAATIFSPLSATADLLPYLDRSVDVVAVDSGDWRREAEARRVAGLHVLLYSEDGFVTETIPSERTTPHRVSIVIPVHGQWDVTRACLERLWQTAPEGIPIEVIVVDDASVDDTHEQLMALAAVEPRLRVVHHPANFGFSHACNSGAAAATGDVLVFLNNDTLPQPDWLPPLLRVLDQIPDAGAVGARLVGLDGRLQEAGAVVFSDGSAWNLGRGAHPDDPIFARLRSVDYCSAAALATRRSLFGTLGGFDTRYSPAYYEDTDYCFGLRAAGHRVFVQPSSTILHIEGGTAGTDESQGIKQHQVTNRGRFVEKWAAELRAQPAPPPERTRAAQRRLSVRGGETARRVLVVAPTAAEFDRESGSRRVFQLLRLFREHDWEATFIAHHETQGSRYARALQGLGVEAWAGPQTPGQSPRTLDDPRTLFRETHFDLAILHFWHLAEFYLPMIREAAPRTRIAVDSVDLHLLRNFRSRFVNRKLLTAKEGDETIRELNVYAASDRVLTVSVKEAALIDDFLGRPGHSQMFPLFEDVHPMDGTPRERRGFVFVGNFRHFPNVEALDWLCREVIPRLGPELLARHPVVIIGNDLTPALVERCGGNRPGVQCLGWVPEIEPYLLSSRLALVPLRTGAGTKRKVIESLMLGTPVVTTSVGAEGLDLVSGQHVLIAESADDFAAAVKRLTSDNDLWSMLAAAGAAHARAKHGPEAVRAPFEQLLALCATSES